MKLRRSKTNYQAGHDAEKEAADYLIGQGYKIIDINWKTRFCEIDIVALRGSSVYFIEVKYRSSSDFGDGLDYITPKKLQKMQFASELWVAKNNWPGDYQLAALSMNSGQPN